MNWSHVGRIFNKQFRAARGAVLHDAFMMLYTQLTMHGVFTLQPIDALRDLPPKRFAAFGGYVTGISKASAEERGKDLSKDDQKTLMGAFLKSSIGMGLVAEIYQRLQTFEGESADLFLMGHNLGEQDFAAYLKSRARAEGLKNILPNMLMFNR